jgi:hypothetical protein
MKWRFNGIGLTVDTRYIGIGMVREDQYDVKNMIERKTLWFFIIPCIAIGLQFEHDILEEDK